MSLHLDHDLQYSLNIHSDDDDGDEIYSSHGYTSNDDSDLDDIDYLYSYERKSYVVLKEDDLIRRQEDQINEVTSVLSVTNDDACMLLLKYNWSASNALKAWSEDKVKVRNDIGLLDVDPNLKFPKKGERIVDCAICFDSFRSDKTANCGCGHNICKVCWRSYVSASINEEGIGCLTLKCPKLSCGAAVGPDMVKVLAEWEEKKKYDRCWLRSYVDRNENIKWCPGLRCERAIEFNDDINSYNYDVTCDCKYVFCWRCEEEAHRPVNCETVRQWVRKTKSCPNKRPVEKKGGCMSMTCIQPCGCEFNWLCCGPSKDNDCKSCNGYSKGKSGVDKTEQQRKLAKEPVNKYTYYYERWDANEKSRKQALLDLHKIETEYIKKLSLNYGIAERELEFIIDAWLHIVECRRVLKWTNVYGYYIPIEAKAKQQYYESLLGLAEDGLERLLLCAEKELQIYIRKKDAEAATNDDFNNFRIKLINLTAVTRCYFQNFVRALEDGLPEPESLKDVSKTRTSLDRDNLAEAYQ